MVYWSACRMVGRYDGQWLEAKTRNFAPHCLSSPRCINEEWHHTTGGNPGGLAFSLGGRWRGGSGRGVIMLRKTG